MSATPSQRRRRAEQKLAESRDRRARPACRKTAFPSKRVAEGRLRTLEQHGMTQVYECPLCGKWHLTHQVPRGPSDVRIWKPSNPSKVFTGIGDVNARGLAEGSESDKESGA
jgi:ribosomal protein L32